jgi:hypothetical protein
MIAQQQHYVARMKRSAIRENGRHLVTDPRIALRFIRAT